MSGREASPPNSDDDWTPPMAHGSSELTHLDDSQDQREPETSVLAQIERLAHEMQDLNLIQRAALQNGDVNVTPTDHIILTLS